MIADSIYLQKISYQVMHGENFSMLCSMICNRGAIKMTKIGHAIMN